MKTIVLLFACVMIPALAFGGKLPKSSPTPTPAPTPVTVGADGNEPLLAAAPDGTLYISALQHIYSSTDSGATWRNCWDPSMPPASISIPTGRSRQSALFHIRLSLRRHDRDLHER